MHRVILHLIVLENNNCTSNLRNLSVERMKIKYIYINAASFKSLACLFAEAVEENTEIEVIREGGNHGQPQHSKTHEKALAPLFQSPGACSCSPWLPREYQVLGLGTRFTKRPCGMERKKKKRKKRLG